MNHSEFEIQAEAYFRLKEFYGPLVRGEYCIPKDRINRIRGARFDICLVREDGSIVLVVEIKKRRQNKLGRQLKQIIRYEALVCCPVICVRGMEQAKNVVYLAQSAIFERVKLGLSPDIDRLIKGLTQ